MVTNSRCVLVVALLLALVTPVASAQEASPSNDRASALLEEAQRLYEQEQFALAAERYLAFHDALIELHNDRAPLALWNAGLAVEHIPGREREALDLFRRFIHDSHALTDDAEVRDMRSEAQTKIANLEASLGLAEGEGSGGGEPILIPVGATLLGIGAAIGLAAIPTGLVALDGAARIETECGTRCPESERAFIDETAAYGIATDVLWVSGVVIAAGGAALLGIGLSESGSSDTASLRPSLGCGPAGCVAMVQGQFP